MDCWYRLLGIGGNNVAEYSAFVAGLRLARQYTMERVTCFSDSTLVVKIVNGVWRPRKPAITRLHEEAMKLAAEFRSVTLRHVPREHPELAKTDALVNAAFRAMASG